MTTEHTNTAPAPSESHQTSVDPRDGLFDWISIIVGGILFFVGIGCAGLGTHLTAMVVLPLGMWLLLLVFFIWRNVAKKRGSTAMPGATNPWIGPMAHVTLIIGAAGALVGWLTMQPFGPWMPTFMGFLSGLPILWSILLSLAFMVIAGIFLTVVTSGLKPRTFFSMLVIAILAAAVVGIFDWFGEASWTGFVLGASIGVIATIGLPMAINTYSTDGRRWTVLVTYLAFFLFCAFIPQQGLANQLQQEQNEQTRQEMQENTYDGDVTEDPERLEEATSDSPGLYPHEESDQG